MVEKGVDQQILPPASFERNRQTPWTDDGISHMEATISCFVAPNLISSPLDTWKRQKNKDLGGQNPQQQSSRDKWQQDPALGMAHCKSKKYGVCHFKVEFIWKVGKMEFRGPSKRSQKSSRLSVERSERILSASSSRLWRKGMGRLRLYSGNWLRFPLNAGKKPNQSKVGQAYLAPRYSPKN